jgi:hypothetical protein
MSLKARLAATREADRKRNAGRTKIWKWPSGTTKFRFVPGKKTPENFFTDFGLHWIKDENGKVVAAVGDASIINGEACPIRDGMSELRRYAQATEDSDLEKKINDMLAKNQRIANVQIIDSNGDKPSEPVIVSFSEAQWTKVMDAIDILLEDDDADETLPIRLDNAQVFMLKKEGSGLDTSYTIMATPKTASITQAQVDAATDLEMFAQAQIDPQKLSAGLSQISAYMGKPVDGSVIEAAMTSTSATAVTDQRSTAEQLDDEIPLSGASSSSPVTESDAVADDDDESEVLDISAVSAEENDILAEIDNL